MSIPAPTASARHQNTMHNGLDNRHRGSSLMVFSLPSLLLAWPHRPMSPGNGIRHGSPLLSSSRALPASLRCRCGLAAALLLFALASELCLGQRSGAPGASEQISEPQASVTIRLWGYDGMAEPVEKWERGFGKDHPEVHFTTELHGPDTAMAGLYNGVAEIAVMGRELWPVETMAFRWVFQYLPFGVEVATCSLTGPGQSFSPVVMVNAANPLSQITLQQLDGIYGSEHRRGGKNLRVWGDLGLGGIWANRPIHAYGYGVDDALGIYFRKRVLLGDYKPNVAGHLLSDRGDGVSADQRIRSAVQADPLAIGYARYDPDQARLKVLPVAEKAGKAAISPTASTVLDRSYPLTRSLSFYVNRAPRKAVPPELLAFLRYILSPAGQEILNQDGRFTALPPDVAAAQQEGLTAPALEPKQESSSDPN
jgi:phosphate transport system substrate-binding protein